MLIALKRSISRPAQYTLPFYKLLRKPGEFKWTTKCKDAFKYLTRVLATPPILTNHHQGRFYIFT